MSTSICSIGEVESEIEVGLDECFGGIEERRDRRDDDGRLELRGSDFELIEETQKEEVETVKNKAPVDSIGIQAFKMLGVLRAQGRDEGLGGENMHEEEEAGITTVSYTRSKRFRYSMTDDDVTNLFILFDS